MIGSSGRHWGSLDFLVERGLVVDRFPVLIRVACVVETLFVGEEHDFPLAELSVMKVCDKHVVDKRVAVPCDAAIESMLRLHLHNRWPLATNQVRVEHAAVLSWACGDNVDSHDHEGDFRLHTAKAQQNEPCEPLPLNKPGI